MIPTVLAILAGLLVGFVVCLITGDWWWILWAPLGVIILQVWGATRTYRSVGRQRRLYENLLCEGYAPFDALLQVSQLRHPELRPETHLRLIEAFPDIDQFIGFMEYAADFGRKRSLQDNQVLALIGSTTLLRHGADYYTAKINWKQYDEVRDKLEANRENKGHP